MALYLEGVVFTTTALQAALLVVLAALSPAHQNVFTYV